jgi:hypothetical protein
VTILTDEHFPEEIAQAVRRQIPGFDIQSIHATELGGLPDPPLLEILDSEHRTLLTRDVNSIPDFLKARLAAGKTHGGVLYVSNRYRQNDSRSLIRALVSFIKAHRDEDWRCREAWL